MSIASYGLGPDDLRALYSLRETQRILSVSRAQLYRLIGRGRLSAYKIGVRTYVSATSINEFLASLPLARVRSA
jgi:excisionase family DNA binding protein